MVNSKKIVELENLFVYLGCRGEREDSCWAGEPHCIYLGCRGEREEPRGVRESPTAGQVWAVSWF